MRLESWGQGDGVEETGNGDAGASGTPGEGGCEQGATWSDSPDGIARGARADARPQQGGCGCTQEILQGRRQQEVVEREG